jgi:hypothetical protein
MLRLGRCCSVVACFCYVDVIVFIMDVTLVRAGELAPGDDVIASGFYSRNLCLPYLTVGNDR